MSTLPHITQNPSSETPSTSETAVGGAAGANLAPKDLGATTTASNQVAGGSISNSQPGSAEAAAEKLYEEVTEKISKTMGYGKKDVQEALEADEPSAIKDAYMIVRENKLMQVNRMSHPPTWHGSFLRPIYRTYTYLV